MIFSPFTMKPIINFEECLRDSPKFRSSVEESEEDIDQLEQKLDKLVKLCSSMVEMGKAYLNSKSMFIGGIVDLSSYFKHDYQVTSALNKLIQALSEMLKYQSILIDQAHRSICKNLNNFIRNDIRSLKETKRCFEKISDEYDQALTRNSQIPKSKAHEYEDVGNVLTATKGCFQHTALDYICQMSLLHSKKRYEVLDTLLSYMHAQTTYFHQGSDLSQDIDPMMKQLALNLSQMRVESNELEKQMEGRHSLVTSQAGDILITNSPSHSVNGIQLEGYLFKRTSNAFKTWNRRWFIIQNNQLVYRKRNRDDNLTVMEDDLRLCSVKPATEVDRRFCFEVLSPSKSHMLQADNDDMYNVWLKSMQAGINAAIQHVKPDDKVSESNSQESLKNAIDEKKFPLSEPVKIGQNLLEQILEIPGNNNCCDCKAVNPRWASINLGVTLCIECSGIHRSLGVHYSKVRSLTLDAWESEQLKIMSELGNNVINKIYECNVDEKIAIPATPDCARNIREMWIKAKYIQKAFVCKKPKKRERKQRLHRQRNIRKLSASRSSSSLGDESSNLIKTDANVSPCSDNSDNTCRNRKRSGIFIPDDEELAALKDSTLKMLVTKSDDDREQQSEVKLVDQAAASLNCSSEVKDTDENLSGTDEFSDNKELKESDPEMSEFTDEELSDIDESSSDENPNLLLQRAAAEHNIPLMCEALARGADMNWPNENDDGKTAVHHAILSGSVFACEYLFLNGAKTNIKDKLQRTPLHLATELGNTGQVCLLLKRGADQHFLDEKGQDALSIAVNIANADIVTLLRLAKLNDEMKESEYGNQDEMFNEVVKDFSKLASDNPEKLRRIPSQEKNNT